MNIIIPMAGRGKRFLDEGYKSPKPFIDVAGVPMIQKVVENINMDGRYIFICLKEFIDVHGDEFKEIISKNTPEHEIVIVNEVTEGAACTVLLCKDQINNDDDMMIANCDQLVLDPDYCKNSVKFYKDRDADGGILCFLNDSPKWSYVRMSGEKITEVVEKQVISNVATVGIYYYRKGSYFVAAAESMVANNVRVNGEFYIAPAYNQMLVFGMSVIPYLINDMVGIGTPKDLKDYLNAHIT